MLGTLGGTNSSGRSINDAGQVVGQADTVDGLNSFARPCLWVPGQQPQEIPMPPGLPARCGFPWKKAPRKEQGGPRGPPCLWCVERTLHFEGDLAGRPYLWDWERGSEVHRRDACATALGPLPQLFSPNIFNPQRLWVGRPARQPVLVVSWGWGPVLRSAPPFLWRWRRISALPRRTG